MPPPAPYVPNDPASIVYRAILSALMGFPDFYGLFRVRNLIHFDDPEAFAAKAAGGLTRAPADAPELSLLQGRFRFRPGANSLAAGVEQAYPVVVIGPSLNLKATNEAKWQAFRALVAAGPSFGLPRLVRGWDLGDGTEDATGAAAAGLPPRQQRPQGAWATVFSVNVEMAVGRADVAANQITTT